VRVSQLLGSRVTTVSGESLGRVFDVRGELGAETLRVTGLVVGQLGVLERLGIGSPGRSERLRTDDVVPWEQVVTADIHGVVVRDRPA
jgi:sporulation protein YlmC with PRC-barrel domain